MNDVKPSLICNCGRVKTAHETAKWVGKKCNLCLAKAKAIRDVKKGRISSKHGNWFCSKCGRVHTNRHSFCWECGNAKSLDLVNQVLNIPLEENENKV